MTNKVLIETQHEKMALMSYKITPDKEKVTVKKCCIFFTKEKQHLSWVFARSASSRRFRCVPKTYKTKLFNNFRLEKCATV